MSVNQRIILVTIPLYSFLLIATLALSFSTGHKEAPDWTWNGYRYEQPVRMTPARTIIDRGFEF